MPTKPQTKSSQSSPIIEVRIVIEGTSPLQMHAFTDEAILKLSSGASGNVLAGERPSPEDAARSVAYLDDKGNPYIPVNNLFQCIMSAGRHLKCGKGKWTTVKSSKVPAVVQILTGPTGVSVGAPVMMRGTDNGNMIPATWLTECFTPPNATGGKSAVWRPVFYEWLVPFSIRVDTEYMPMVTARQLIDAAGKWEGLGPMRCSRRNLYGQFVVSEWSPQV